VDVRTEVVQLLMEAGFLAVGKGMFPQATAIFAGVAAVRPESELPIVGQAIAQMNSGRADDAIQTLKNKALVLNPDSQIARSFLGLALKIGGFQAESRALLSEVVKNNSAPEAVALAQDLLAQPA